MSVGKEKPDDSSGVEQARRKSGSFEIDSERKIDEELTFSGLFDDRPLNEIAAGIESSTSRALNTDEYEVPDVFLRKREISPVIDALEVFQNFERIKDSPEAGSQLKEAAKLLPWAVFHYAGNFLPFIDDEIAEEILAAAVQKVPIAAIKKFQGYAEKTYADKIITAALDLLPDTQIRYFFAEIFGQKK